MSVVIDAPRRKTVVIGAGTMGHGIAYAAAAAGFPVVLTDASTAALSQARKKVDQLAERAIQKGRLDNDSAAALRTRVTLESDLPTAVGGADLVIEAVPEQLELKQSIFRLVEEAVSATTVLASNTSAISITEIASALSRPERFLGMHFFNPVPVMRLVEIVRGAVTNDAVVLIARTFSEALGKTAIVVRDSPGFATSRLGVVLGLEAIRMLEQGVAEAADIDRAMELGYNHPMGPLRLTDLVGLDVRLAIAEHLHAVFGLDTYRPPELLRTMVAEGRLGRKSGSGFYEWPE